MRFVMNSSLSSSSPLGMARCAIKMVITGISMIALSTAVFASTACAPPSIGEYPDYGDNKNGGGADDKAGKGDDDNNNDDGKSESKSSQTDSTGNAQEFKVNVTLKGTGSVTSSPAGITCTGTTCTGSFAKGTQVTLTPTAGNASFFSTWSGQCTGAASCAPVVNADVAVTAEFESFDGKWTGTYTNMRRAFNCNFTNNGNLETTLSTGAASSTANMTGLELRQVPGCGLVRTSTGSAPSAAMTIAGDKMTGTWTFTVQGASGTLAFPFTATFKGKTMTGTWTCDTCNGGFTLTKQ